MGLSRDPKLFYPPVAVRLKSWTSWGDTLAGLKEASAQTCVTAAGGDMGGMTFSAAQTGAKAGVGERYLPKRVELAAKIETSNEVSPHDFVAGEARGGGASGRLLE